MHFTSRDNATLKMVRSLKTRSGREKNGLFLVEGVRAVQDALRLGADVRFLVADEGFVLPFACDAPCHTALHSLFAQLCDTQTPQGVLAVCASSGADWGALAGDLVIVCDNVQDPGNLGTIIRTADAAGAAGVVLTCGTVDLYNPKTVRATMSSLFSLPIVRGMETADALAELKARGFRIVCGALRDDAVDLFRADLRGKCAVVVGNEGSGVSDDTLRGADVAVKIPMRGGAESLNVAIAAAVLCYETVRQNTKASL